MDSWIYIALLFGIVLAITVQASYSNQQRKVEQLRKIRRSWGKLPEREYEYSEFEQLTHYFRKTQKEGEFAIDDITWNDLDMDSVFMALNATQSSAGEEYLYKALRMPVFDEEVLKERSRLADYFRDHKEEREKMQLLFVDVGKTRKLSLIDYALNLNDLPDSNNAFHYGCIMLIVASIVGFFANIVLGVLLLVGSAIFNVATYYRDKGKIEKYFTCIAYIVRLVKSSERISKEKIPELQPYFDRLAEGAKPLHSLVSDSAYIGPANVMKGSLGDIIMDYVRMFFHIDLIKFNSMKNKIQGHMESVQQMIDVIGQLELGAALASYRETLPFYCHPDFTYGKKTLLQTKDLFHPLISDPVANSINENRCVLLTGSNASGKSTFLKTVAINAVLAQTVYTVLAHNYHANMFRVYSSMALRDDLAGNESYYIVEIKSLKRILDAKDGDYPVMCFVDEVLRGTNTVERIAASTEILKDMSSSGMMCFAATHDIELTHLLESRYSNYHFQEEIRDNDVKFNYVLYSGRATTRNAIKLLGIMGYDEAVIRKAEDTANRFLETGKWTAE